MDLGSFPIKSVRLSGLGSIPFLFRMRFRGHWLGPSEIITSIQINDLGKKKCMFLDYFFFYRSEAGASASFLAQTVVYLRSKIYDVDIPMYTLFTKFLVVS